MARPLHLRARALGLVALGGAVGTALREAVALVVPGVGQLPVATLAVNILGAFLLGLLLEALVRRGPDEGRRRTLRLLLGTGLLGGFTTYSALATDTGLLLAAGAADSTGVALLYAIGTVLLGGVATLAGIALAVVLRGRRTSERPASTGAAE